MPIRYPSQNLKQFLTRFPDGMRERIEAAAEANKRPMNSEIIARLEWSFQEEAKSGNGLAFLKTLKATGRRTLEEHVADLEVRIKALESKNE